MSNKNNSKDGTKVVSVLKRDEFVTSVSKNLATLRTHKNELESALALLSAASNADAAFPTLEQVKKLNEGMAVASKAAAEMSRLLKLRLRTKVKEI